MIILKNLMINIGKLCSYAWIFLVVFICFGKQYIPFTIKGILIVLLFISLPLIFLIWRGYVDRHSKEDKRAKKHQKRLNKKHAKIEKKEKRLSRLSARKRKFHEKKLNKKHSKLSKAKKQISKKDKSSSQIRLIDSKQPTSSAKTIYSNHEALDKTMPIERIVPIEASTPITPETHDVLEDKKDDNIVSMVEEVAVKETQQIVKIKLKEPLQMEDKVVYEFEKVTNRNPLAYVIMDENFISIRQESIENISPEFLHGPTPMTYSSIEEVLLQESHFPKMGTIHLILKDEHNLSESVTTISFTENYLELGKQVVAKIQSKITVESLGLTEEIDAFVEEVNELLEEEPMIEQLVETQEVEEHEENLIEEILIEEEIKVVPQPKMLTEEVIQQLKAYKELLDLEIITKEEFEQKKSEFLS